MASLGDQGVLASQQLDRFSSIYDRLCRTASLARADEHLRHTAPSYRQLVRPRKREMRRGSRATQRIGLWTGHCSRSGRKTSRRDRGVIGCFIRPWAREGRVQR